MTSLSLHAGFLRRILAPDSCARSFRQILSPDPGAGSCRQGVFDNRIAAATAAGTQPPAPGAVRFHLPVALHSAALLSRRTEPQGMELRVALQVGAPPPGRFPGKCYLSKRGEV